MCLRCCGEMTDQMRLLLIDPEMLLYPIDKWAMCPAHGVYGQTNCTMVIAQIIQQKGMLAGLPMIYAQLLRCQRAAKYLPESPINRSLSPQFDTAGGA